MKPQGTSNTRTAVITRQLQAAYQRTPLVISVNGLAALLFAVFLWSVQDHLLLSLWLSVFVIILALRLALFNSNGPRLNWRLDTRSWANIYMAGMISTGLMWGLVGFLFFSDKPLDNMIISLWVLGISMGAIVFMSYFRFTLAFISSCNVPVIVYLCYLGGTFYLLLALAITLYLVGFTVVLVSVSRFVMEALKSNIRLQKGTEAREELQEEILLQSELLSHLTEGVYLVRMDGTILFTNPEFEEMFGYDSGEMLGQNASIVNYRTDKSPRETAEEILAILDQKGEWKGEILNVRKDGTPFWSRASVRTYEHYRHGKVLIATHVDVTEHHEREETLRMLSSAVEQTHEAIAITDREATILYINPAFTSLTGYSLEQALGKNPRILKSGKQDAAFYEEMWGTLNGGEAWQSKVYNKRKDGSIYPALLTVSPIKDKQGEIVNFAGIQQDLTAIQDLESQLLHAQKMEALGTLVGGIAHEFNNSLSGVISSLYLAKLEAEGSPALMERLKTIEKISLDSAELIKSLLQFARKGIVDRVPFAFIPFFKEFLKLIRASLPDNIQVIDEITCSAVRIEGDLNLLQQVLVNVVNNARDALTETAEPHIRMKLESTKFKPTATGMNPELEGKDCLLITVSDNGCGMSESLLSRVFEPFHTTKEVGKGTGLGLSMSYGAVQAHGGLITVDSIEDSGTDVRIWLPVLDFLVEASHPDVQAADRSLLGNGELILLVDDNENVLESGRETLESLGYRVLTADNGKVAFKVFEQHKDVISLVLSDVVMPGMSGVELVARIQKMAPDIKFILSSGYDRDTLAQDAGFEVDELIEKPFRVEFLAAAIRLKLGNRK